MILLFSVFSLSTVFGVDFGSESIKVGMALAGKSVHVALNQQSKRLSPSYFAFWKSDSPAQSKVIGHWTVNDLKHCDWAFADAAKAHGNRFPGNVIRGLSPILASEHGFTRREYTALVIRHLITTVDEGRWKPDTSTLVFTVEPFFPFEERVAIGEAMSLTNATLAAIIDSPTAAATTYALEKRKLFEDGPKIVAFVDVGAKHSWAAVFRVAPGEDRPEIYELGVAVDFELGGGLIDEKIAKRLMQVFTEKNKVEVTGERAEKQFVAEAVRAKELLSLNEVVDIRMEDVVGDYGINYQLSRVEVDEMMDDLREPLKNLYLNAVKNSNISCDDVQSIELIGGSSRVPYVKDVLLSVSGMTKLNRTMNSDEAIALGATYVGVSKNSAFIIKSLKFSPLVGRKVALVTSKGPISLYNESDHTTENVTLSFGVKELERFSIIDGDTNVVIQSFSVILPSEYSATDEVTITFGFNHLLVPTVINASMGGSGALGLRRINPDWMLDGEEHRTSQRFIYRMDRQRIEKERYQKTKNDFESYLYKVKNRLEYDYVFQSILTRDERRTIEQTLKKLEAWFDGAVNPSTSDISTKHGELKKVTREVEVRCEQLTKREQAMRNLNSTLINVYKSLNITWPVTKKWLPTEKLDRMWTLYNSTREWYEDKIKLIGMASLSDAPVVMDYDIARRILSLEKLHKELNNLARPTPTPVPKVKQSAYSADAYMPKSEHEPRVTDPSQDIPDDL